MKLLPVALLLLAFGFTATDAAFRGQTNEVRACMHSFVEKPTNQTKRKKDKKKEKSERTKR